MIENQHDMDRASKAARARRRAVKAVGVSGAAFVLGLLLRLIALGRLEWLGVLGNYIAVAGFLGLAWWCSVLYDYSRSSSGGGGKSGHP